MSPGDSPHGFVSSLYRKPRSSMPKTTEVQKATQCQSSASEYYFHVILQRKRSFGIQFSKQRTFGEQRGRQKALEELSRDPRNNLHYQRTQLTKF